MSREVKKPKRDKTRVWCPGGMKNLGCNCHTDVKKFVRCSVCGQRFEPYLVLMPFHVKEGIYYVPKHKAY